MCYYSATLCEHSMVGIVLFPVYLTEVFLSSPWTMSAMRCMANAMVDSIERPHDRLET